VKLKEDMNTGESQMLERRGIHIMFNTGRLNTEIPSGFSLSLKGRNFQHNTGRLN